MNGFKNNALPHRWGFVVAITLLHIRPQPPPLVCVTLLVTPRRDFSFFGHIHFFRKFFFVLFGGSKNNAYLCSIFHHVILHAGGVP